MERRHAAPLWRASLGLVVTAIAATLLVFAVLRVAWLNNEAGNTLDGLTRERTAVAYQQQLFDLLVKMERFRLKTQLIRAVPSAHTARLDVDRQMSVVTNFTAARASTFDVGSDWAAIQSQWATARNYQRGYAGPDLNIVTKAVTDLIYKVEDNSGLEYDSHHITQDLGDIVFAKLPGAVHETLYADLIGENAQSSGSISIGDRVLFAGLLNTLRVDYDLTSDDWDAVVSAISQGLGTRTQAAQYQADGAALLGVGNSLYGTLRNQILLRQRPQGDAVQTRQRTHSAVDAASSMNARLAALLDQDLRKRVGYEASRNDYIYLIVLLAALLIVGIMLLVAEFTARREREALQKAHQEAARLGAELARQKAERALRLSEAQFRAVFDGAALGIAIFDRNGVVLDANTVYRNTYGDTSKAVLEGHDEEFAELMRGERDLFEFEQHAMTPAGQESWTDTTMSLVHDDAGTPYFAICMFRDLTELKRNERRMQHDMTHDGLTGLPNHALFESKVREQFAEAEASPEVSFAVLVVDLDRFKDINESLGREAGDFVLSQVAHRLRAAVAPADIVARLGSDEFAVLVRSLPDVLQVELTARLLLSALSKPVSVGTRSIFISGSVGIAIASGNYRRCEEIMRDADIAMRYAKGLGSRFAVFDSNMHARAEKRLQLTTDLRLALERNEFDMLYQPIVTIDDGQLIGCEALLRWNHPTEGIIYPGNFMPLAEQTGLAIPIGRFVIRTVCRQLSRWRHAHGHATFPINVNVSAAELLDPEFESVVLEAIDEFGVDPHDLTLEITESVVLDSGTRPNALVERLRAHGFNVCIDDFGTGYSSLRYLQQFKVDAIKIDRSFVSGKDGDVASEPIVRTLMSLAEAFDVRVVAEGIETQRQREVLHNAGCRFGQGFYYARALSADEIAAMYPSVFERTAKHVSA